MTFILNGAPSAHDTSDENSTRFHNPSDDQLSLKNVGKMSVCFSFLVLFGPEMKTEEENQPVMLGSPGEEGKICLLRRWPLHAQRARQFALAALLCFLCFSNIPTFSTYFNGLTVKSTVNMREAEIACRVFLIALLAALYVYFYSRWRVNNSIT